MTNTIFGPLTLLLIALTGVVTFLLIVVFLRPWLKGVASGVTLSLVDVLGMYLRNVPPGMIIDAHIMTVKAGCPVPLQTLEAHHLAGGHVEFAVRAMVDAHQMGMDVGFDKISAIDLAGEDVLRAIEEHEDLDAMLGGVDLATELSPEEYEQLMRTREWLQSHPHRASIIAFLRKTNAG